MKRILVCSDLSARADRAVERAFELARGADMAVTLLHVIDEDLPIAAADAVKKVACDELTALMARLDTDERVSAAVRVVAGQAHRTIVEQAEAEGAELIVLGAHRNEASQLPLVGSTMARVIRNGPLPVLVVRRPVTKRYANAVVAVDFSVFSRAALRAAISIVAAGDIHLVHVYHVPFQGFLSGAGAGSQIRCSHRGQLEALVDQEMAALVADRKSAAGSGPALETHALEGEVHATLRQQITALHADLLVIGTHGRTGIARAWFGSMAEDLLVRPPCDVLVVKAW